MRLPEARSFRPAPRQAGTSHIVRNLAAIEPVNSQGSSSVFSSLLFYLGQCCLFVLKLLFTALGPKGECAYQVLSNGIFTVLYSLHVIISEAIPQRITDSTRGSVQVRPGTNYSNRSLLTRATPYLYRPTRVSATASLLLLRPGTPPLEMPGTLPLKIPRAPPLQPMLQILRQVLDLLPLRVPLSHL